MLTLAPTEGSSPAVAFAPDLGAHEHLWLDFINEISDNQRSIRHILDARLRNSNLDDQGINSARLRYFFSLSIISDLVSAGAALFVADSTVYIAWPDWMTVRARDSLRTHLEHLRDETISESFTEPARRGAEALPVSLRVDVLLQALREGEFRFHEGKEIHPLGMSYDDIFSAAIRSWSMPYRDREGRRVRYVLTLTHELIGESVPVGIIEACDGPPFHPLRDGLLGVTFESFQSWLGAQGDTKKIGKRLADRVQRMYDALRPAKGKKKKIEAAYKDIINLEKKAAGRSKGHQPLKESKSQIYVARLARAHRAASALRAGIAPEQVDVSALARVMRDLILPRVSLEISVCGALPPFSEALVGKLVAGLMAHQGLGAMCRRPAGQILQEVFDTSKLKLEFPNSGAVLLTTQGLYAKHSAQYQRVVGVGKNGANVPLKKIGLTQGATTSLMSRRTFRLAGQILKREKPQGIVSLEYGSGGSKRQRQIEAAVLCLGISKEVIHPSIQRPYYAMNLVENLPGVVLLNEKPIWIIESRGGEGSYVEASVERWRRVWLDRAHDRLARKWGAGEVPGLVEIKRGGRIASAAAVGIGSN